MTALEKVFFTPLYSPDSAWSVVKWWESRRPVFNLCVGAAGVTSIATATLFGLLPPRGGFFLAPWQGLATGVLVFGVMANVCYSLGPVADLMLRKALGDRAPAVGTVLFRYGFVFSLGLTLLPIPVSLVGWLLRLL